MIYLLLMLGLSTFFEVSAQNESAPYGLILNLLSQPQQVYVNGYPTSTPLKDAITQNENFQFSNISSLSPSFGWIVGSGKKSSTQTAYRLLLASDKKYWRQTLPMYGTQGESTVNNRSISCITEIHSNPETFTSGK